MEPSWDRPTRMSSACLLTVEKLQPEIKFNQRNEKNAETEKSSQTGQNNKDLVIKQSQGPLVPPQGLQVIF